MKIFRLIAALLCLSCSAAPVEAAVVWFAGIETGSLAGEMGATVAGSCTASTARVRSGAYSLSCPSNSGQWATPTGFALNTAYVRFYVNYSSLGNINVDGQVITARSSSSVVQLTLNIDKTTRVLKYNYAGGSNLATGSWVLVVDTWYLIEVKFVNAAGTGGMEVKIDNVVQFSDFTRTTNGNGAIDHFVFGANACCSWDPYYDDMLVSNSGYPGPGRSISRQGTAGTPTYAAWTKNSCAGGTIDGCWSNIPLSTSSNATSSTPADAQTMLVAPFSSTQSGHGTTVLASGDTINACTTIINAKAATGSQIYIRRRLGGSNTDTLKNLSGTDTYYNDGIWTDTFTNLNAAEIGAVQNSGP